MTPPSHEHIGPKRAAASAGCRNSTWRTSPSAIVLSHDTSPKYVWFKYTAGLTGRAVATRSEARRNAGRSTWIISNAAAPALACISSAEMELGCRCVGTSARADRELIELIDDSSMGTDAHPEMNAPSIATTKCTSRRLEYAFLIGYHR